MRRRAWTAQLCVLIEALPCRLSTFIQKSSSFDFALVVSIVLRWRCQNKYHLDQQPQFELVCELIMHVIVWERTTLHEPISAVKRGNLIIGWLSWHFQFSVWCYYVHHYPKSFATDHCQQRQKLSSNIDVWSRTFLRQTQWFWFGTLSRVLQPIIEPLCKFVLFPSWGNVIPGNKQFETSRFPSPNCMFARPNTCTTVVMNVSCMDVRQNTQSKKPFLDPPQMLCSCVLWTTLWFEECQRTRPT